MDQQPKEEKAVDEELIRQTVTAEEIEKALGKKEQESISIQNSHGKPIVLSVGREKVLDESICPDCKGRGIIIESHGLAHTCWRCLNEGRLDVHTKELPRTKIRL